MRSLRNCSRREQRWNYVARSSKTCDDPACAQPANMLLSKVQAGAPARPAIAMCTSVRRVDGCDRAVAAMRSATRRRSALVDRIRTALSRDAIHQILKMRMPCVRRRVSHRGCGHAARRSCMRTRAAAKSLTATTYCRRFGSRCAVGSCSNVRRHEPSDKTLASMIDAQAAGTLVTQLLDGRSGVLRVPARPSHDASLGEPIERLRARSGFAGSVTGLQFDDGLAMRRDAPRASPLSARSISSDKLVLRLDDAVPAACR